MSNDNQIDSQCAIPELVGTLETLPEHIKSVVESYGKACYATGKRAALAHAAKAEPQACKVPDGWKLVPIEPNNAMREVLTNMLTHCHTVDESYSDLLAAVPADAEVKK